MEQNSLVSYISFGTALRYLQDAKEGWSYQKENCVKSNIERVLRFLDSNGMRVSINAASKLVKLNERFGENYASPGSRLSIQDARELAVTVRELRFVIINEAKEIKAFFPREKRYNADMLYGNIGSILGNLAYGKMPEAARLDFEEAGKCILLERSTAAAFHMMRGCECVLNQLYRSAIRRGRRSPAMWGNMVEHMIQKGKIDEALKGTLDNFRRGFRNPTAHPNKFYAVDEAQDLLGTSIQLVALGSGLVLAS